MPHDLESIWGELEARYAGDEGIYRRLDLEHEIGIRMAVLSPGRTWAILVEIPPDDLSALAPPRWRGMGVKLLPLAGPEPAMKHICLYVEAPEHRPVFTALCSDVIKTLESSEATTRVGNLQQCFRRWSRFFERWGQEGITPERQRGLFGELDFLELLLTRERLLLDAVSSWKGCSGGVHDFARGRRAVEVKTTISKEPRKVSISSERQLDDGALASLDLFILTLQETEGDGMTLPEKVAWLRKIVEGDINASSLFESDLISAGYLDSDADKYLKRYATKKREAYIVRDCFPRITAFPPGIGDLQYTLTVSACEPFKVDLKKVLDELMESTEK